MDISNSDDIIDSRDVINRIEELEEARNDFVEDDGGLLAGDRWREAEPDDYNELISLRALAEEAEPYCPDWEYGEALIRDSYFQEYAEQLADDIGAIDADAGWPVRCIDWAQAAAELQVDYTPVEFDGVTYWVR